MRRPPLLLSLLPTLATLGCGDVLSPTGADSIHDDTRPRAPVAADFSPGGAALLTDSPSDRWPELEGDRVAWYRAAPADQEGLWLMDLGTGEASRIWAGTVLSAFDLQDGEVVWGSAGGLRSYDVESGSLVTLAGGLRQYRDVEAGPRYIIGTATQSSARPFVYDRAAGTEALIPTPTSVPGTRGWGDWVLWTDHRESLSKRDFFLRHIPTGAETQVADQSHFLSSANAAIHGDRVVYFARRFCPGPLEMYVRSTGAVTQLALPPAITCPVVVELEGDILVYRHASSASTTQLGFLELDTGESVVMPVQSPGTGRVDADLDGTRVVHTSAQGLALLELRFQPPEPPVAETGGPYQAVEGTLLTLDGTGSRAADGGALRYRWEMGDGTVLEGTATPTHAWADDGTFPVHLTVLDEDGLSAEAETAVVVANQPPSVSLAREDAAGPGSLSPENRGRVGEPLILSLTIADPGLLDAPWSWEVGWDGGVIAAGTRDRQGTLPSITWTPRQAGTVTLTATVRDKDGGVAWAELVVEVVPDVLPVEIRAGSGPRHSVPAPGSNGIFPVVVLGSDQVPVSDMDRSAFRLSAGEARPVDQGGLAPAEVDVDEDGHTDLRLHFRARDAGFQAGESEVCLAGATLSGITLRGCGPVDVGGSGTGG